MASSTPATVTLASGVTARSAVVAQDQEKARKRPVRPIFSDQPVNLLEPTRRQRVARRR